jgi:hypothetical protein
MSLEVRETILFREFVENGKVIERHSITKLFAQWVNSEFLTPLKFKIKIAIGKWALAECADQCPNCRNILKLATLEMVFPHQPFNSPNISLEDL